MYIHVYTCVYVYIYIYIHIKPARLLPSLRLTIRCCDEASIVCCVVCFRLQTQPHTKRLEYLNEHIYVDRKIGTLRKSQAALQNSRMGRTYTGDKKLIMCHLACKARRAYH